jgi:hypothetical protein
VLAHIAGIPVEEALLAAPGLLASLTVIVGYARATARTRNAPRRLVVAERRFRATPEDD